MTALYQQYKPLTSTMAETRGAPNNQSKHRKKHRLEKGEVIWQTTIKTAIIKDSTTCKVKRSKIWLKDQHR